VVKALFPHKKGQHGLLPYEITAVSESRLRGDEMQKMCMPSFLDSVRTFIQDSVVGPAVKYREAYGLLAALKRDPKVTDASLGATGRFRVSSCVRSR
jgi:hypothetical protein